MRFEHAIIEHYKNSQNEHPNWDILPILHEDKKNKNIIFFTEGLVH